MGKSVQLLESAINRYLALDPDTLERIAELSGKVIVVEMSDWRLKWIIFPGEKGLTFSEDLNVVPTVTLRGNLFDLIKVGRAQGSNQSLFSNHIDMIGDADTGEKIREILRKIDIDWEEHLSQMVGDSAAHRLFRGFHKIKSIGKNFVTTIRENITEYLQIESSSLPSEAQMENFFQEINELRNDVDRLEARIHRIAKGKISRD